MPSLNTGNAILSNPIKVDSSYNVGIGGAASGSFKLQVTGTGNFTGALSGTSATFSGNMAIGGTTITDANMLNVIGNQSSVNIGVVLNNTNSTHARIYALQNVNGNFNIRDYTASSDRLSIASTGAATFSSSVTAGGAFISSMGNSTQIFLSNSATTGYQYATISNTGANLNFGIERSTGGALSNGSLAYASLIQTSNSTALQFGTNNNIRATIDSSGNVGIGTSSIANPISFVRVLNISGGDAALVLSNTNGTAKNWSIGALDSGSLSFWDGGTERMRITSGGYAKFTNNGTYLYPTNNFFSVDQNTADWLQVNSNRITSGTPLGIIILYTAQSPNSTGAPFIDCTDSVGQRFGVRSNGGIANYQANDVNLSDERTKKDIEPLESYWNKFKAIEIVKFKYKDQTHDDFNIGVIAQQVEKIAPEFVDVDGWDTKPKLNKDDNEIVSNEEPLKSIYTADLHHATIKVLQEAMAKIENQQAQIEAQQQQINSLINR